MVEIRTDRLVLRPLGPDDTDALHRIVSQWEVVRQLGGWPWPADRDFTRSRAVPYDGVGNIWAITLDGALIGSVGVNEDKKAGAGIGYMLDPAYHGKGIMSEAVFAAVAYGFAQHDWDGLVASTWFDNPGSDTVLRKLGFVQTETTSEMSKARKVETELRNYTLSRADWADRNSMLISVEDLQLRPLTQNDVPELRAGLGVPEVSEWLHSIPSPWPHNDCADWVEQSAWTGRLNTRLGIVHAGKLCGTVGLHRKGTDTPFLSFAVMPDAQGQSVARRAAGALLRHVFRAYGLEQVDTYVLTDNAASIRVLEKLGFQRLGAAFPSPKLAPRLDYHYRLTQQSFEARHEIS